jgi:hypothetical protein
LRKCSDMGGDGSTIRSNLPDMKRPLVATGSAAMGQALLPTNPCAQKQEAASLLTACTQNPNDFAATSAKAHHREERPPGALKRSFPRINAGASTHS